MGTFGVQRSRTCSPGHHAALIKSQRGQPEWELRNHIQYTLGWNGFQLAIDSLFFDQVAFLISRKGRAEERTKAGLGENADMWENLLATLIAAAITGPLGFFLKARLTRDKYLADTPMPSGPRGYDFVRGDWYLYHFTGTRKSPRTQS
jgi:hypothetical protein